MQILEIANVFSQMGIVEELGSGTRKIFKYTPLMSGGKLPQIEEEDVYKVTIPIEALASDGGQKSIQEGIQKSILIYRIKTDVICLYYFNEIA